MNEVKARFEPEYQVGKAVCNVIILFGWIAVILGFVVAYKGVFPAGNKSMEQILLLAMPGLALVVTGFLNIALGQIGVATIDNSNANNEILSLMKLQQKGE